MTINDFRLTTTAIIATVLIAAANLLSVLPLAATGVRTVATVEMSPSLQMTYLYFGRGGMMWIGTSSGLVSYDGYVKRIYRSDAFTPGLFPNNSIVSIAEDGDGYLWIGTRNGIVRMDSRTGQCKTYHLPGEARKIIYSLYVTRDNTVWVGTDGGLAHYDRAGDKFVCYGIDRRVTLVMPDGKKQQSTGNFGVKTMTESHDGKYLYIGTWSNGVLRLRRGTSTFSCYPSFRGGETRAFAVHLDRRGRLWIGTWGGELLRMDRPTDFANPGIVYPKRTIVKPSAETHNPVPVYDIIGVGSQIFACLRDRIAILDTNYDVAGFVEYPTVNYDSSRPLSFNNWVTADRMGNVWLQERFGRIRQLSTQAPMFQKLFDHVGASSHPFSSVYAMHTYNGSDFWLALMPFGLARYNRSTGTAAFNTQIAEFANIPDHKLGAAITSIAQRRNGELWMASTSYGIFVVKQGERARVIDRSTFPSLPDDYVNAITERTDGTVWVGTRQGLAIFSSTATSATNVTMSDSLHDFSYCDIRSIRETRDGSMWIATENEGIIRASNAKGGKLAFRHYSPANGNFFVDDATSCYEDSHGRMWAISTSGGLFCFDRKRDAFDWVNAKYHINGASVYAINEDSHGNLWLTTEDALVRLSANGDMTTFTKEDGMGELLFLPNSTFKHNGEMYFGCANGFFAFSPDKTFPGKGGKLPQLIVSDIMLDGVPYRSLDADVRHDLSDEMPDRSRRFNIPPSAEKFSFDLALLDYTSPEHNRFAYKLRGYNDEWQYLGAGSHRATFENIPSGKYQLEIKAADRYGNWQTLDHGIEIHVLPPWYNSWWAYVVYALAAAALAYAAVYLYKENLKTKNRLRMAVVFTNIAHELLTPLTVISANVDSMRSKAPEYLSHYDSIQENINRLTRLLRQILEVRKSQAGKLRLLVGKGDLQAFVERECELIRPLSLRKGITLHLSISRAKGYFDPDKVQRILQNLLSNAIKYTEQGGEINVKLSQSDRNAVISVADSGIGIPKDKMTHLYSRFLDGDYRKMNTIGTGLGLSLTRDLVRLHHGTIDCQSQEGEGTTFIVTLPIARQVFSDSEVDETMAIDTQAALSRSLTESVTAEGGDSKPTAEEETECEHSILIVEDNAELLTLMASLLHSSYNVYTANDGQKALNVIARKELDIVVSDVMMPVMDGIELTRTIKGNDDTALLPVILLTAKSTEEDRNEAYAAGADSYLTKPFRLDTLKQRIDNIIANRERLRRKFMGQTTFEVEEQHYSSPDANFVERAIGSVKTHLADSDYDREAFASDMCVSGSTLYNKLRAITGQSVTGFINSIRLKEACAIARRNPAISISELSLEVGFNTPKYFSKCFKKEFGMSLKEYLENDAIK